MDNPFEGYEKRPASAAYTPQESRMSLPASIPIKHADGTVEYVPTYTTPYPEIEIRLLLAIQERLDAIEKKLEENKTDA